MSKLSPQEITRLIQLTKENKNSTRLSNWLSNHPEAINEIKEYTYSDVVLPKQTGTTTPQVGVIFEGIIELQGLTNNICQNKAFIHYPLAIRYPGEVIGEVEFLRYKYYGGTWMRNWIAYSGLQTLYITQFRRSKEGAFFDVKNRLRRSTKIITKVVWLSCEKIDLECLDILNEISVKRLLDLTSSWKPDVEEIQKLRFSSSLRSIELFRHVLASIQGLKLVFRSIPFDEISGVTPWDENTLGNRHGKDYGKYEDCLVLGAFQVTDQLEPIIILPHFLSDSLAMPSNFNTIPEIPNNLRQDLIDTVEIAKEYLTQNNSFIKGMPNSYREVAACYSMKDHKRHVHTFNGEASNEFVRKLGLSLKIEKLKTVDDLRNIGLLGSASIIVLP